MTHKEFAVFLDLARRFRETPVVDDDFPLMRVRFDFALSDAIREAQRGFPTVVCLCGSTRFMQEFYDANMRETLAGKIVLSVGTSSKGDCRPTEEQKLALDELHLRKIDAADEVLILNVLCPRCPACKRWWQPVGGAALFADCRECPGPRTFEEAGYVGDSTRRELAHARSKGKVVRFLNPEPAR